jgi:hypothetical protein
MSALLLAMDKSMRTKNEFGHMFIKVSNISKACVNPYRGSEIPNGAALGLDMERVYQMLRDPKELAKAAETFNNLPLLDRHIPVTADEPSKEFIVGSTGTDAHFEEPYLRSSLVIWCGNSIAGVETNQQRELSSAYSYTANMTPGIYEGVAYDGIMQDIKGNHVALVEVGRAGPDVIVGDSQLLEIPKMKVGKLSANRKTLLAACLTAAFKPLLAQDAQIKDLTAIAGTVDSLKTAKDKTAVVNAVKKHYGEKLAQDADLAAVVELLDALGDAEETVALDEDEELDEDGKPKKKVAEDADDKDEPKPGGITKPAMDAAIATAVAATRAETIAHMNAIHTATAEVAPFIGALAVAQDSAENIYKLALDAANVDTAGVHPSAFRAMVGMLPKPGTQVQSRTVIAQDAAGGAQSFAAMFKTAVPMKGGA